MSYKYKCNKAIKLVNITTKKFNFTRAESVEEHGQVLRLQDRLSQRNLQRPQGRSGSKVIPY